MTSARETMERGITLIDAWLEHCKAAGHKPKAEGGKATYSMTTEQRGIYCCARGCDWKKRSETEQPPASGE